MRWEHAQHNPEKKNKNGKVVRRYAWNVQCAGNMRSIILNKNPKTAKQFGFYAWNVQCAGNMRSIILNKKTKTAKSLGAMLGMPNALGTCAA
jgi:hypothetical protein